MDNKEKVVVNKVNLEEVIQKQYEKYISAEKLNEFGWLRDLQESNHQRRIIKYLSIISI